MLSVCDNRGGIMKEYKAVEVPKGFEPKPGTINGEDVTIFVNEKETLQLVYAVNEEEQKDFYLYTAAEGILGLYRPLYVDGREVYIVSIPENMQNRAAMAFATLSIDGEELQVWTFNDEELVGYSLMYIMGDDGKLAYYIYKAHDNTYEKYRYIDINGVNLQLLDTTEKLENFSIACPKV